jgi:drug/metabolite transporter (DMT)-like permease
VPYVLFLACSLIWSASFILMKKAALGYSPWGVGAWRCVWGAIVLGLLCWRTGSLSMPRRAVWKYMALVAVMGCAWPYAIQPMVVSRQGSSFMALVVSFVPLATIAVSIPILNVWPTRQQLIGVIGALGCLGLLLVDVRQRHVSVTDFALAVTVPVCYALANTIIRGKLRELPAPVLTFHMLVWSAVLLVPISFESAGPVSTGQVWWLANVSLAILGILGTGLATYWFNKLVRDHGPLFAGMTTNLVPIGALLWGSADKETVTGWQWIALIGIVAMVGLVQFGAAANKG